MKTTTKKTNGIRIRSSVKAGNEPGIRLNHNGSKTKTGIRIRTALKGGLLLPAVQASRASANHNAQKVSR